MRVLKATVLAAAAALTLASAVVPASAGPHWHGGGGWGHHGWGHGGWGWGGPGLVFGLGVAALAAGAYELLRELCSGLRRFRQRRRPPSRQRVLMSKRSSGPGPGLRAC